MKSQSYSANNPPPSREAAQQRLASRRTDSDNLTVSLETKPCGDFRSPSDYESWKLRARRALAFMRLEIKFLEGYLDPLVRAQRKQEKDEVRDMLREELMTFALACVEVYAYTPLYTGKQQAVTLDDYQARHCALVELKQQIAVNLTELKARSLETRAPQAAYCRAKEKIAKVLNAVERELGILRRIKKVGDMEADAAKTAAFTQLQGETDLRPMGMVFFLAGLIHDYGLDRVPKPDESRVLALIQDYTQPRR